jgi:hypothetical protein
VLALTRVTQAFRQSHNGRAFGPAHTRTRHRLLRSNQNQLEEACQTLSDYNTAYLSRMREGRKDGLTPQATEFKRIQADGGEAVKAERATLRAAAMEVVSKADEVVLGIMADTLASGIRVLKTWIPALDLPRGVLRAVDANGAEIELDTLSDSPGVYIKYNSSEGGDAYCKAYTGGYAGVIIQPKLQGDGPDDDFRQYGDFPLALFV